jgi:DNA-binding response OmpR family regulator
VLFGADDLLPKPLNMDFLLHRIQTHIFGTIYDQVQELPEIPERQ